MNAEMLIKARKVFVEDTIVEYTETCPHCASKGIDNKLRYYYISLDEAIYKCNGAQCLYPYEKFIFKNVKDNSVYYYEEVLEGGREAVFRVPLDGTDNYQSTNPLSTELFCDSQRNPNIESYDLDFSDLFNDFEAEPKFEIDPKSNVENPDFLDFLDETVIPSKIDTDKVLDKNGIDKMIANLSPIKNETKLKSVKDASSSGKGKIKTEAKLTKCIQHIEKTKRSKSKKANEKPPNKFTVAIRKARKNQSNGKVSASPVKTEPVKETVKQEPLKQTAIEPLKKTPKQEPLKKPVTGPAKKTLKREALKQTTMEPAKKAPKKEPFKKTEIEWVKKIPMQEPLKKTAKEPTRKTSKQEPLKHEISKTKTSKRSKSTCSTDLLVSALDNTNTMRPTELVKKLQNLNSIDLTSIKSNFLAKYLKENRRKKREKNETYNLKNILKDWDDDGSEQGSEQGISKIEMDSNKFPDEFTAVDDTESIISISSAASDNSVAILN
ncbi:neurofilament heavy polypeptide [Contarinia nasturtii]|uniref:neurofilament heavy polypeptide n=1 Tax=Contarinia nasturtii TaxID=265458 RepID=UPI0012D3D39B|nr:neurofilament heavy polypeptide [Contarinia nasturtii]